MLSCRARDASDWQSGQLRTFLSMAQTPILILVAMPCLQSGACMRMHQGQFMLSQCLACQNGHQ
jgi:hypothetical protein